MINIKKNISRRINDISLESMKPNEGIKKTSNFKIVKLFKIKNFVWNNKRIVVRDYTIELKKELDDKGHISQEDQLSETL